MTSTRRDIVKNSTHIDLRAYGRAEKSEGADGGPTSHQTLLRLRADVAQMASAGAPTSLRVRADVAPLAVRQRADVAPMAVHQRADVAPIAADVGPLCGTSLLGHRNYPCERRAKASSCAREREMRCGFCGLL